MQIPSEPGSSPLNGTAARNVAACVSFSAYAAWIELRERFARTWLGPLWGSLGLMVMTGILGTFFGALLKSSLPGYASYIPYLGAGLVAWAFISTGIGNSCAVLSRGTHALRFSHQPFAAAPLKACMGAFFELILNLTLFTLVYAAVLGDSPLRPLGLLAGALLLAVNVFWASALVGLASLRFRDLPQLVSGLMHVVFLLTPILWKEDMLGRFRVLADINPAYHLVSLIRSPLIGEMPSALSWILGVAMAAAGGILWTAVYSHFRRRIPYWL